MTIHAPNAYASTSPLKDTRSAEAAVLGRITGRIVRAAGSRYTFPELAAALEDNRRFWSQAAADLSGDGNRLPQDVRVTLLGLAAFTARHTPKVLSGAVGIEPLVAIDSAVVRGLTGEAA